MELKFATKAVDKIAAANTPAEKKQLSPQHIPFMNFL